MIEWLRRKVEKALGGLLLMSEGKDPDAIARCSVCAGTPAVQVSGTYYLCGPCVLERIEPSLGQQSSQDSASQIPSARGDFAGSGPPNGPSMKWVSVDRPTWYAEFPMYWECARGHLHVFRLMAWICERRSLTGNKRQPVSRDGN